MAKTIKGGTMRVDWLAGEYVCEIGDQKRTFKSSEKMQQFASDHKLHLDLTLTAAQMQHHERPKPVTPRMFGTKL